MTDTHKEIEIDSEPIYKVVQLRDLRDGSAFITQESRDLAEPAVFMKTDETVSTSIDCGRGRQSSGEHNDLLLCVKLTTGRIERFSKHKEIIPCDSKFRFARQLVPKS